MISSQPPDPINLHCSAGGRRHTTPRREGLDPPFFIQGGFERLAEVEEEILWLCEAACAGDLGDPGPQASGQERHAATRGEYTDAAMGSRAERGMLNNGDVIAPRLRCFLDRRSPVHAPIRLLEPAATTSAAPTWPLCSRSLGGVSHNIAPMCVATGSRGRDPLVDEAPEPAISLIFRSWRECRGRIYDSSTRRVRLCAPSWSIQGWFL